MTTGITADFCISSKDPNLLPLPALLTSTDGGIVGNDIWQNSILLHHRLDIRGLLPMPALLTSTDGGIAGSDN